MKYKSIIDNDEYYSCNDETGKDKYHSYLEVYSNDNYVVSYCIIDVVDDDDNVIGYTLEACWSEDYDYKHNVFEDLVTSDITILNEMLYKMYETKSLIVPVSGTITIVPYWK